MTRIRFIDYKTGKPVAHRDWPTAPRTGDLVNLTLSPHNVRAKVSHTEWLDDGTAEIHLINIGY